MTNSLIPYSFVPGTKAKAQEVNANFIALSEHMQETQTTLSTQLTEMETSISDRINSVESAMSENCADSSLVNTGAITNTILLAPNGTVEYDGQTLTVKKGLQVLIPDGLTDNHRLKNIEYTTEEPLTKTATNFQNTQTVLFLSNEGTLDLVTQTYVLYKNTTPTTLLHNLHWYNTDENQWYKYVSSESRWAKISEVPIAVITWNSSNIISAVKPTTPLNLVKHSDLNDFYTIRGILPKELDYVVERFQSNYNFYTIYKSGWVEQGGYVDGSGDTVANFYVPMGHAAYNISLSRISGASTGSNYPIWIRTVQPTYIKIYASGGNTGKCWTIRGYRQAIEEV